MRILVKLLIICLVIFSSNTLVGDPMRPPMIKEKTRAVILAPQDETNKVKAKPRPEFILSQIIYSKSRKLAVINKRMLVEGDRLNNAKVIKISQASVQLKRKGRKIILKLYEADKVKIKRKDVKQ